VRCGIRNATGGRREHRCIGIGALLAAEFATNTFGQRTLAELLRIKAMGQSRWPACILAQQITVRDLRNSSAGPYMDFEDVATVMFGLLALLGFALLVIFGIAFSEGKTTHPINKSEKTLPAPDAGKMRIPRVGKTSCDPRKPINTQQ
jgi:hypothetical protein